MYDPLCTFGPEPSNGRGQRRLRDGAPEHHAPKALRLHDIATTLRWLANTQTLGRAVLLALPRPGDSAGGNLARSCVRSSATKADRRSHQVCRIHAPMRPRASPPSRSRPEDRSQTGPRSTPSSTLPRSGRHPPADDPLVSPSVGVSSHADLSPEPVQRADHLPIRSSTKAGQDGASAWLPLTCPPGAHQPCRHCAARVRELPWGDDRLATSTAPSWSASCAATCTAEGPSAVVTSPCC